MADQPITGLPTKTASGVAATDKMLGIDSAEGYQILVRDVAKYIIENCDVSTLAGAVRTPKAAIDALKSNTETKDLGSKSTLSDFNNSLTTLANSMNSQQIYNIRIVASGSALSPFQYATYYGTLTKNTSTSFFAHLSCGLDEIYGEYINNDWVWENTFAKSYSLSGGTVVTANTDLNTLKTVGNYYAYTQVAIVNGPMSAFSGILKVEHSAGQNDGFLRQILVPYNSNNRYERVYNNTQWLDWELRPTRSEITALNSKQTLVSVSKYSTEGGIVLDTSPSTSRPFGILMIGYEGMTHFKVVADSVEKTGTIGTDPGYYDSETHSFKSNNSNREITIIAPSNMANLS